MELEDSGLWRSSKEFLLPESDCESRGEWKVLPLRGVPLVTPRRRVMELSGALDKTRSDGFAEADSISCAQGLLLGSTALYPLPDRSRAARLSLLRSRIPRALGSRFAGVRFSAPAEFALDDWVDDAVGPDSTDTDSDSASWIGRLLFVP